MSAEEFLPNRLTLTKLREAVQECRGCPLYQAATQAVFGEGPATAKVMLIGETPGNDEDLKGHPFVGPAGKLLEAALTEVGINRSDVYLTNVVKHFKWEARGKRRIHKKPSAREIRACHPWLAAEMSVVHPQAIVCLGAVAAQALLGSNFRITQSHGEIVEEQGILMMATWHPSAILRAPESNQRATMRVELITDLSRLFQRMPSG